MKKKILINDSLVKETATLQAKIDEMKAVLKAKQTKITKFDSKVTSKTIKEMVQTLRK